MREYFARFRAHLVERGTLYSIIIGASLIIAGVLGVVVIASKDQPNPSAISYTPAEWNARASSGIPTNALPNDILTPLPSQTQMGATPVAITSPDALTTQLRKLSSENKAQDTVINSATQTVVTSVSQNGEPTTIAARYLPTQAEALSNSLASMGIPVSVVTSPATPPTTLFEDTTAVAGGPPADGPSGLTWFVVLSFIALVLMLTTAFWWKKRREAKLQAILDANDKSPKDVHGNSVEVPNVTFADVAGAEEAVEDLQELVAFLTDPTPYEKVGAVAPKGGVLVGPPGTGKTLIAKAVAGEARVPFYAVSGSDFMEMFVGVGSKRVRELFARARKHPEGAIIFIDEIDAIGRKRGDSVNQHPEQEATLNAMLVEMDGFRNSRVIVLAATNRVDVLDPALLRPGRLDRRVQVPLPDRRGREQILQVYLRDRPIAEGVDVELIARRTPGMSGADLAQLVNEACLQAAREQSPLVSAIHFDAAVATVAMGKARLSAVVTENDREVTAWHEAGHTVAAMVLPDADDPVSVSIIPRGPAGGVTWMASGDDLFLTRKRAFARLVVAMAGRAAEEIHLDGEFTSGPHGDLQAATNTAMAMVTQYGMTDSGLMIRSEGLLSTGSTITDATVAMTESLLAEALSTAREVLRDHRDIIDAVVEGLLENDTLTQKDLVKIREGFHLSPPALPPAPHEYRKTPALAPSDSDRSTAPPAEATRRKRRTRARGDQASGKLVGAFARLRNRRTPRDRPVEY